MDAAADERAASWWHEAVRREERGGELLSAFDFAERGLAQHPDDAWLTHRAVLALARAGATEEAARRFEQYGLADIRSEDAAALRARILKDLVLDAPGPARQRGITRAAAAYQEVFAKTGGYYPAINAATLSLLSGDSEQAKELARQVIRILARGDGSEDYYAAATEAEAWLLLGREDAVSSALQRAAALYGEDYAALATTRRQLRTICEYLGLDTGLLAPLAGPGVVHFCGHRIAASPGQGGFMQEDEKIVAARVHEVVTNVQPAFAYGALASGADIVWAETLLRNDSELHIVLPFAREEFIKWSVSPAGAGWVDRFDRCLGAAASVRYATDDAFLGDDVLFRYAGEYAMGLALLRSRYLDAEARQLAIWDERPARGLAGTAIDVATWRRGGRPVTVVSPSVDGGVTHHSGDDGAVAPTLTDGTGRTVRAMLFGDVKGFSKLTDEQLPVFVSHVLGGIADVLKRHEATVLHRNTWGDAVYAVLVDASAAATCALDLQTAIAETDLRAIGLPEHIALRLGAHVGPVFPTHDPVLEQTVYMGSHVSRTARIEPVTPPGAVYVTEPFAALLELDANSRFVCEYVGHTAAAKGYGRFRMYRLRRRRSTIDPNGRTLGGHL